ncbi:hypothetical protein BDV96DRAFT_198463 [Lophiotrema nucula]|uniref:Uncharacterized protein n=1 Tax=Lophiotrema nucula TaxID=690887 RepID=A0A6A5YX80_9PLEO|nr:hypothetical protein BDV96DRAFT_198463 [Lophiotrema nucula]
MMANNAVPNVWTQMSYVPPRGQCNFKPSILAARCPCLRFMLHPLKSSSSYECDGCSHHASFHSMENKTEDEIQKRWELEAREKQEEEERIANRPKKRLRQIEYTAAGASNTRLLDNGMMTPDELEEGFQTLLRETTASEAGSSKGRTKKGTGKATKTATAARGTRSRGRVTEIPEDDEEFIELD